MNVSSALIVLEDAVKRSHGRAFGDHQLGEFCLG
jgi:hypothetical protein